MAKADPLDMTPRLAPLGPPPAAIDSPSAPSASEASASVERPRSGGSLRRRLMASLAVAAGVFLAFSSPAQATSTEEARFVQLINDLRASRGLPALEVHSNIEAKAQAWARTMAEQGRIWHSNLKDGITVDWSRLGENVGMGPSVQEMHDAFVASPHHYENLVHPDYRYIGLGVVEADGTLFVAQEFMTLRSSTAPQAPTPAPVRTPPPAPVPQAPAASKPTPAAPVLRPRALDPIAAATPAPSLPPPAEPAPSTTTTVPLPAPEAPLAAPIAMRPIAASSPAVPQLALPWVWAAGALLALVSAGTWLTRRRLGLTSAARS